MVPFTAYKYKDVVYINKEHKYRCGEILCSYLNFDIGNLENGRMALKSFSPRLQYPKSGSEADAFKTSIQLVQKLYSSIYEMMLGLEPYTKLNPPEEPSPAEIIRLTADRKGIKIPADSIDAVCALKASQVEERLVIEEIEKVLQAQHKRFLDFCDDVLRVDFVYKAFLDNYYHVHPRCPDIYESANALQRYISDHLDNSGEARYKCFVPIYRPYNDYEILDLKQQNENRSVICEVIRFYDCGSFLATELYSGLQAGSLPRRCGCCKQFFISSGSQAQGFCEKIAPGETIKTCRDIGARKKHDEKVKADPVWAAYQKSYKTHYARYMKKKMSAQEFDSWKRFAIDLRDRQSGRGVPTGMSLEEYIAKIRE